MRTNEEILERYHSEISNDVFGVQRPDLISLLPYEAAKPHLKPEYVQAMEDGTLPDDEKWADMNVKDVITGFLPMAFIHAMMRRALYCERSLLHFKTLVWYDDPDFYKEILNELENCEDYGVAVITKIGLHYGVDLEDYMKPLIETVNPEEE